MSDQHVKKYNAPDWWRLMRLIWRERQAARLARRPEPALVMDDPLSVKAFHHEGRGQGAIQPIYYFNALRMSQMTPPGGLVIDFGSGSGQYLRYFAQMRPDVRIIGFDLSDEMIALGNQMLRQACLHERVRLIKGDMTGFKVPVNEKVHVVSSIFSLHHLPSKETLRECLRRIADIRDVHGAGVWIFDHARPHHPDTAAEYPDLVMKDAPAVLRQDSCNSLIASWSFEDLTQETDAGDMGFFHHEKVVLLFGLYQSHYLLPQGHSSRPAMRSLRVDLQIAQIHAQSSLEQIAVSTPRRVWALVTMVLRILMVVFKSGLSGFWFKVRDTSQLQMAVGRIVAKELGKLKGPLMKMGQVAALCAPKLSDEVRLNLSTLSDTSATIQGRIIRGIVESELQHPIAEVFEAWTDEPFACGVVAQVHHAVLKGGKPVMVKVRYPGLVDAVKSDLRTLGRLKGPVRHVLGIDNIDEIYGEIHALIMAECDFLKEAKNQLVFRRIFAGDPRIVIPDVFLGLCTPQVLVMEYIEARNFKDFAREATQEERNLAGETIWRFAATSIHQARMFHADPHPGNYLFQDGKVVFLDFGFVKRWPVEFVEYTKQQALSICSNDAEAFANATRRLGYVIDDAQCDYERLLKAYRATTALPWCEDRHFQFSPDFIYDKLNDVAVWQKKMNLVVFPEEFVAYIRLYWGLYSLLTKLNASANWQHILLPTLQAPSYTLAPLVERRLKNPL